MKPVYDSRDSSYKRPFGAVESGTQVQFTVSLPPAYSFSCVTLCVYDGEGYAQDMEMVYLRTRQEQILYRCTFTPEESRALFYYFRVLHENQTVFIKQAEDGTGYFTQGGPDFQLTVYGRGSSTPDFIKGGIIYQIFPDRFCYSGKRKEDVPDGRILRSDWGGLPYFMPDEDGEVLNNDYFCGDLKGIESKLPYLQSLGVTLLYLNPIFEAHSSHRYNTADYLKIDPLLGTEADFTHLCNAALHYGIRIILDGVFSHTGDDSVYFNRAKRYNSLGAYNSTESRYYPWYKFIHYPDVYESWWGFTTLPVVDKSNPDYIEFICGENGVLRKWLRAGASGFRLDVADELPDAFIERIRQAVKAEGEENLLIGEVWEDASNKMAYGVRRRYFMGKELDSVMNYPFKDAILWFLRGRNKQEFINRIMTIVENYPPGAMHTAMNSLSTHDVERAITVLVGDSCEGKGREWQSCHVLDLDQYEQGVRLLKCAMVLQYFLPGVPCIYYGDEAGLQGYKDPFNRKCFPWGSERMDLVEHARLLARLRHTCPALKTGSLSFFDSDNEILAFKRRDNDGETLVLLNYTDLPHCFIGNFNSYQCLSGEYVSQAHETQILPYSFAVFIKKNDVKR